jgi:hypothetical protein
MNEPTANVKCYEAKKPENEKNDGDCPKHGEFLSYKASADGSAYLREQTSRLTNGSLKGPD